MRRVIIGGMNTPKIPHKTAAEMREADRRAIEEFGIPGIILMENAGRGAADIAIQMLEGRSGAVAIFAGRGNNGGDAFVVARHLHNRRVPLEVFLLGEIAAIKTGDAATNLQIILKMGIPVRELKTEAEIAALGLAKKALIIDGLLGTGLSGPVAGLFKTAIEKMNSSGAPILALDIPSGLSADDGTPLGTAVKATATATFGAPKAGFAKKDSEKFVGKLHIVEISIPREILEADDCKTRHCEGYP
jgi:NAD(P)H-hydrate epimerase